MNCPHGGRGAAVFTKKCGDHEIFIMIIFIHGIFSNFTKILNHESLELYGIYKRIQDQPLVMDWNIILCA